MDSAATSSSGEPPASSANPSPENLERLRVAISNAASLLPAQGPITAFVFLNTLEAFEHVPFDEGVRRGGRLFGCQPYWTEDRYHKAIETGRITLDDVEGELLNYLGETATESIGGTCKRIDLFRTMLLHPIAKATAEELRWFVAETDALRHIRAEATPATRDRFLEETRTWAISHASEASGGTPAESFTDRVYSHDIAERVNGTIAAADSDNATADRAASRFQTTVGDLFVRFGADAVQEWDRSDWEAFSLQALWRVCRDGVHRRRAMPPAPMPLLRHRDVLLAATKIDMDEWIADPLIKFCAAFTDQGFARWKLPLREVGFFEAFSQLYRSGNGPLPIWMEKLPEALASISERRLTPLESAAESLQLLGVPPIEWEDFLPATILALKGWAGTLWQMEVRGDRVAKDVPAGTLVEFVAVRLLLKRLAAEHIARARMHWNGPLAELRHHAWYEASKAKPYKVEPLAFQVFQLAQLLGWTPPFLFELSDFQWSALLGEIERFSSYERRKVMHHAFERNYHIRALDAIAIHATSAKPTPPTPKFQAVFCIDTREESFRRHLEETAPEFETFGAPGFYGIPMYFRGVADATFTTLCPIVVRPKHWVTEEVVYSLVEAHKQRSQTRRVLGKASHEVHQGTFTAPFGAVLTGSLGVLASIPLIARVLFPRWTSRILETMNAFVEPPPVTRLVIEREGETPSKDEDGIGFSVEEMATMGENLLRQIGLTSNFARLVMFFGHGSFCLNNPHKSCYDCGACSGSIGGPNARALAVILNDPRIRSILASRGLSIPSETVFIGGWHNTTADAIIFSDLDLLPRRYLKHFDEARALLAQACERNAHERCRRFDSAPLDQSPEEALQHVEGRSQDLAQTRPEFGNATNGMVVVGRRLTTRGLYMDRRCFMQSYDPYQDDEDGTTLGKILSAVVPVCSGINLQYYFSTIDSAGWGSGTKLPHNVTSLLGVMDGSASDLRSGLPWQGVEIHEPLRLMLFLETRPEVIERIMKRNAQVERIIRNEWMRLALIDPDTGAVTTYREGKYLPYRPTKTRLPSTPSSLDWYRGRREHLGFARLEP